jgi:hypothetical protein
MPIDPRFYKRFDLDHPNHPVPIDPIYAYFPGYTGGPQGIQECLYGPRGQSYSAYPKNEPQLMEPRYYPDHFYGPHR